MSAAADGDDDRGARRGLDRGSGGSRARTIVARLTLTRSREQAARPDQQRDEEDDMPGEQLPFRIDRGADRLRDAQEDAARERAPERAEAADDDRLEGEDEARRTDRRIEIRAHAEEEARRATQTASASPMAMAKTCRLSTPMSCAVTGSSDTARNQRPSFVR